jgi:hypothetical protein
MTCMHGLQYCSFCVNSGILIFGVETLSIILIPYLTVVEDSQYSTNS